VRSRTIYYGLALALVVGLTIWGFSTQTSSIVHAIRDRNPDLVRMHDGAVRNGYTLKIANHGFETATIEIRYAGVPGAALRIPGRPGADALRVQVEPNRVTPLRIFVTVPTDQVGEGSRDAAFEIRSGGKTTLVPTAFDYGSQPQ
jgi:polyferredoxin